MSLETQTSNIEKLKKEIKFFFEDYGDDLDSCHPEAFDMLYEIVKKHKIINE
ncbi:MAG: hypothetical protein ACXAD7_22840 [Candidatus Kariarchaeaceae archaeon]|jgi:hypothetical protein